MDDQPPNFFIFSYAPLVKYEPGFIMEPDATTIHKLSHDYTEAEGEVKACVWAAMDDGSAAPIFVLDNARRIANHLKKWAEGKPSDWFYLSMAASGPDGAYQLVLMPDFQASIKRQRLVYKMQTMKEWPEKAKITFLFKPLTFFAKRSELYLKMKDKIPTNEVMVGFMDRKDLKSDLSTPDTVVRWLGPFRIGDPAPAQQHLEQMLKDPDTKPFLGTDFGSRFAGSGSPEGEGG